MRHLIAVAGLAAALAGCGQGAGPAAGNTSDPAATVQAGVAPAGTWPAENACKILDKGAVADALGVEVKSAEIGSVVARTENNAGFSTCNYTLANGDMVALLTRQSPEPDNTPEAMKRARDEVEAAMGKTIDVGGVGKGAFWIPTLRQVVVFLGDDRYFNITMPKEVGDKDVKTLALALAAKIN